MRWQRALGRLETCLQVGRGDFHNLRWCGGTPRIRMGCTGQFDEALAATSAPSRLHFAFDEGLVATSAYSHSRLAFDEVW